MSTGDIEERLRRLEEMETRVRVLEDVEAIKKLQYRYVDLLIEARFDEIMELFAEESKADFGGGEYLQGKEAIEKHFKGWIARFHVGKEGDFVVHPTITVNGDKAKAHWLIYLQYYHPQTWEAILWVQGYYDFEYVREKGEWKISVFKWKRRLGAPGLPPDEYYLSHFPASHLYPGKPREDSRI